MVLAGAAGGVGAAEEMLLRYSKWDVATLR